MTTNEQELEAIANSEKYEVPHFDSMRRIMDDMSAAIGALLANSSDWKGETAVAGKAVLEELKAKYAAVGKLTVEIEQVVGDANGAVDTAIAKLHGLPTSAVPTYVLNAVGTTVPFMGIDFPINGAVGKIASLLAAQREQVARDALDELERRLDHNKVQLREVRSWLPVHQETGGDTSTDSTPQAPTGVVPPQIPGGSGSGPGSSAWTRPPGLSGPTGHTPSVDDPLNTGTVPGTNPTGTPPWTGYPKPDPGPIPGGGGGLVPGLGGAAGAAGLAAAARLSGGAGGFGTGGAAGAGAGAGARIGSGLSGTAGAGATGAGGGAASGSSATGAGARGGSSVMGGGGAGGGAVEKEKRSGLGGLIAPKLEDDEELGPRSASADAGGRD